MKRLILSLAILAGISFTTSTYAQEGKRDREKRFMLPKELNLTADQQKKLEKVNVDFKVKMDELRNKSGLTKETRQAEMKALRQEHRKAIDGILTAEQQAKIKDKEVNHRDRMRNNKPAHMYKRDGNMQRKMRSSALRPVHRGERMKDLNLTDDQKQKIEAVNKDYKTKRDELSEQRREAINKIYTPEQQAKINNSGNERDSKSRHGLRGNLDEATKTKLNTLKENYEKEKRAIELSRIAPEAQKQKIADLRRKYNDEKRQLISDARKADKI